MTKDQIFEFFRRLAEDNPAPETELEYGNAYQLVVAVALSAQATDVGVNKATRALFREVETPQAMLALGEDGLKEHIKTIGLFNSKAKNVIALSQLLVDEYGGMEEALAWTAAQADLGSDWHVVYLGTSPSTYDTLLRQWLIGDGEESGSGGDVFARMARGQASVVTQVAADADRLLGAKGAQAYCLACPSPQAGQSQASAPDGWLARIAALLFG